MAILYPATLPTSAFAELVDVLTSGELGANADRGIKAGWIILGWGLGRLLGDPDDPNPLVTLSADDEDQIRAAAAALFAAAKDPPPMSGPISSLALSLVIKRILEFVIEAILNMIEARDDLE